jgi:glutamyl-tRNA synthetase
VQFNPEKLRRLNQHYIRLADCTRLGGLVHKHLVDRGVQVSDAPQLEAVIALYKERVATMLELAEEGECFISRFIPRRTCWTCACNFKCCLH